MAVKRGGPSARTSVVATGFVLLWALALTAITWFAKVEGTPNREFGSIALGFAFAAVATAVLIGELRGSRWVVGSGGCALIAMSLVTFSPAAFPILIPASFLVSRGLSDPVKWSLSAAAIVTVMSALAIGAVASLVLHDDSAEWTTNGGHHSSSDIITRTEASLSLSLSGLTLALAVVAPRGSMRTT